MSFSVFTRSSLATLTVLGVTLVPFSSSAVVIDFDDLTGEGIVFNRGFTYIEDGFVLNNLATSFEFASVHPGDDRYFGSVHFYNNAPDGITRLTQGGGAAFDINSISLNSLNGDYAVPVTFTGQKSGGGKAIQSFTTDALAGFETFFFGNDFDSVTEVTWVQADPFHYFDNIVINQAVSVPEPSTIFGFATVLGFGAVFKRGYSRRQKKAKCN
ncbi:MAG: PEP-CTERM sorting domain-containing protein [Nostoc sp. GBBB01]|nr:PEP-CTERM sorting domain-containing protein [Nostoc sp. GBBB01]